jgi:hypothetical protein
MGAGTGVPGACQRPTNLEAVVTNYLHARTAAQGTRDAYSSTLKKWEHWGKGVALEQIGRKEIREFLDSVYERALAQGGSNPGRTANKAREHLRAVMASTAELSGNPRPSTSRSFGAMYPGSRNRRIARSRSNLGGDGFSIGLAGMVSRLEKQRTWSQARKP